MKCIKVINPRTSFDPRSFRTLTRANGVRILVGCPKGKWNTRTERCRVGTRAYEVIKTQATRCKVGERRA